MKKLFIILVLSLISCSESTDEVIELRLYDFKAELFQVREEMETNTGRIYRTIKTNTVLLEKKGINTDEVNSLKEIYDRGVEVDLEVRDPGNLTIKTTKTYKVTVTVN